jgi:hypothetical protein
VKDLRISYPVVMGTDAVDADFGGHPGYPTTFLIGKDWKVYRKMFGVQDNKKELLARDITILLNKEYDPPIARKGSDTATVETVELK